MRRRRAPKRKPARDPKYNNELVGRFINAIMIRGKKSKAEKIMYDALDMLAKQVNSTNPVEVLTKAIENVRPLLQVKPRRVGGATYQVPIEVAPARGIALALRWIKDFAHQKKGKPMADKLAEELLEAYKGTGRAIKKREDTHKMAEANKAFSHYRW